MVTLLVNFSVKSIRRVVNFSVESVRRVCVFRMFFNYCLYFLVFPFLFFVQNKFTVLSIFFFTGEYLYIFFFFFLVQRANIFLYMLLLIDSWSYIIFGGLYI